jgi:hypothetical protein
MRDPFLGRAKNALMAPEVALGVSDTPTPQDKLPGEAAANAAVKERAGMIGPPQRAVRS